MYYLGNVDPERISPEVTVKGFMKCCTSIAVVETDVDILWHGGWECEWVCGKMKALIVKMETLMLIG